MLIKVGKKGFSFVGLQYRITTDNDHFYIDLVFYNYILKCFMHIDLKTEKQLEEELQRQKYEKEQEKKLR